MNWEHSDEHCSQGLWSLLWLYWLSSPSLCITSFTPEGLRQHEESIVGETAGWELRPRMYKANSRIRWGETVLDNQLGIVSYNKLSLDSIKSKS